MQQKPKTGSHRGYGASCFFAFSNSASDKQIKNEFFSLLATRLALWLKPKLGGASDKQIKNEFFLCSPLGLH